jgi:hypothetical protein
MNNLLAWVAAAALATGCATPPPPTAAVGGSPSPGDAIAAELGFHGPVERPEKPPGAQASR